ncbi:MAG: flavodoxin domain-containing protein [Bifidobacteriaceae bacterium]|jgi:menaquinone-dependent protoporphyrinogen IX oxidase|nr:flavodoxin domain-containing protein [Bifidobacteriaceae bacterium]
MTGPVTRVVTFSRYGSTDEVGAWIAAALTREQDQSVYFTDSTEDPSTGMGEASAVIVGAPVYAQHLLAEARHFLAARQHLLAGRDLWLFTCSMSALGVNDLAHDAPDLVPAGVAHFAGRLDFARLNRAERLLMRALRQSGGDRREQAVVEHWAASIGRVGALLAPVPRR